MIAIPTSEIAYTRLAILFLPLIQQNTIPTKYITPPKTRAERVFIMNINARNEVAQMFESIGKRRSFAR